MNPLVSLPLSHVGADMRRMRAQLAEQGLLPSQTVKTSLLPAAGIATAKATSSAAPATNAASPTVAATDKTKAAASDRLKRAAQDFEAVFLRQMLSCLEKTTKVSSQGHNIAGQETYGSMIVDAVAEAVAKGGGLGLANVMARAMDEKVQSAMPGALANPQKTPQIASPEMHEAPLVDAKTDLGTMPSKAPPGSRPVSLNDPLLGDVRISPQGLSPTAVPRTEIRASAAPIKGPLADRRIR